MISSEKYFGLLDIFEEALSDWRMGTLKQGLNKSDLDTQNLSYWRCFRLNLEVSEIYLPFKAASGIRLSEIFTLADAPQLPPSSVASWQNVRVYYSNISRNDWCFGLTDFKVSDELLRIWEAGFCSKQKHSKMTASIMSLSAFTPAFQLVHRIYIVIELVCR